MGKSGSI